ncbi:unnamed protein product, partial [Laminaria digitata]
AVTFVWRERNEFLTLAFPAILVLSILNTAVALALAPESPEAIVSDAERLQAAVEAGILPFLLLILPFGYFWTTFAIAWHRKYLLPKEQPSIVEVLTWRSRHTRFLLAAIGLTLATAAVLFVGIVLGAAVPLLLFLALIGAAVVYARLSQVLPSASIDHGLSFTQSWALTKGQTTRLFAVVAATWFPTAILASLLQQILIVILDNSDSFMAVFVRAFVGNVLGYLTVAIGVSVLSLVYDHLRTGQKPSVDMQVF